MNEVEDDTQAAVLITQLYSWLKPRYIVLKEVSICIQASLNGTNSSKKEEEFEGDKEGEGGHFIPKSLPCLP